MKNIHILPTDKPSRLHLGNNGNFVFGRLQNSIQSINDSFTNQNIYITSDEEIKEGDWCLDKFNQRWKLEKQKLIAFDIRGIKRFSTDNIAGHECKKIILTTDQDLIKDSVQAIDDEFLEWFIKNPSCEEVEVEDINNKATLEDGNIISVSVYKIIIPKEEPKQDSLEEVAERLIFKTISGNYGITSSNEYDQVDGYFETYNEAYLTVKLKLQQERSYSEEEVIDIAKQAYAMCRSNYTIKAFNNWFEQFKKK